jgi:hypothetical protein
MTNEEGENEKIRLEPQIFDARYITDRPSFRLSEISEITECFVELANKLERFEEKIPVKGESESDFGK